MWRGCFPVILIRKLHVISMETAVEMIFIIQIRISKETGLLIGTLEVCPSLKYAVDGRKMGILRIDLKSEYERWPVLKELMDVLICHIYEDLEVASIIMKIQKDAGERQKLIKEYQFVDAKEECNISLEDYYIRYC